MPRRKPIRKPVRTKPQGPKLGIRITREEKEAYLDFIAEVKRRRPYVSGSDVIREHIGLTYTDMITDEMRQKLRQRIERIRGRREESVPPVESPGYRNNPEVDPAITRIGVAGSGFPRLVADEDEPEPITNTGD